MSSKWEELKQGGSTHYKTGKVEPIDLYKSITPHPSLSALSVFALCNIIKYAFRQLTRGYKREDCDKIRHYASMIQIDNDEKGCKNVVVGRRRKNIGKNGQGRKDKKRN